MYKRNYFKKLLGGDDKSYSIKLQSPFPPENRNLILKYDIDTRYKYRDKSYYPICKYINETLNNHEGNFLVFFPSYEYMTKVYEIYSKNFSEHNIYLQESVMTEEERGEFLERFSLMDVDKNSKERTIGFVVLGGVFSEGIDLIGDRLKGAIIVGVGLPKISFERKLIEEYFNKIGELGFHYAYTFPGMNKVIQAMGRVIRTEEDKGTIMLLDKRYKSEIYQKLMPIE